MHADLNPDRRLHASEGQARNLYMELARYQEAEQCFREDLKNFANNGWSLGGLYKSLDGQGKKKEAAEVKAKFAAAFAEADQKWKTL